MSKVLLRNTIIYALGNIGSKVISFFIVPLYTYFLTTSELGYYDLILTSISLVIPVVTFQLSDSIFRWLIDKDNDEKLISNVISNVFILTSFSIGFLVLTWIILGFIFDYKYVFLLSLLTIGNAYYILLQQTLRGLKMNRLFAMSGVIFSFLLLGLNLIFLFYLKFKIEGLLISNIIAYCLVDGLMIYYGKIAKFIRWTEFSIRRNLQFLKYSLPLLPNTISWWLITLANRYVILLYLGAAANGLYAVANKFPTLLFMINSFFILAWQEEAILSAERSDKDLYYSNIFSKYAIFLLSVVVVLISFTKIIFSVIISEAFFSSWQYVSILYLSAAIQSLSMFYGAGYLSNKQTSGVFISTFAGAVFTITFSFILTQVLDLYGMAIATLIGVTITFIIRIIQTRSFFHISIPVFPVLIVFSGVVLVALLQYTRFDFISWFISLVLFWWLNRELIADAKSKIKIKLLKSM